MNYNTISYGSQGDEVKLLQNSLNSKGYDLAVDGIFGKNTQWAVRDYQSKNDLAVDGIVGVNTWGSLMQKPESDAEAPKGPTGTGDILSGVSDSTAGRLEELNSGGFKPSGDTEALKGEYESLASAAPGAFSSEFIGELKALYSELKNRPEFSYDPNTDPVYQSYRDAYVRDGRLASIDNMAEAAALTGGYGSSYSQAAGDSAYAKYLSRLNDVMPQMYSMAYERYNADTDRLLAGIDAAGAMYDREYGAYRDSLDDYYARLEAAYAQYNDQRQFEYDSFADERDYLTYLARTEQEQSNWEREFALDEWYKKYTAAKR